MKDSTRKFALGAILAGVAGYVTGILTAPKSGKETRQDIKDAASAAAVEAEKKLKGLHTELVELMDQLKGHGSELSGKAKMQYDELMTMAKAAKDKVREVLSALHEGEVQDEDLKHAVKESGKAIEHIKAYLKKPPTKNEA